jgi:hypothetical protein
MGWWKNQGIVMVFTEKLVPNQNFRLAEEGVECTLNVLLLVFDLAELDMLYETSEMQMIYQHIFIGIGNITITFPFPGLLFCTRILRMSAHVAPTLQVVAQTAEAFGMTMYIPGVKIR